MKNEVPLLRHGLSNMASPSAGLSILRNGRGLIDREDASAIQHGETSARDSWYLA